MQRVGLHSKAGKIFWASLIGYILSFGAFFYNTQYALSELEAEVSKGSMFATISNTACEQMKGCKRINSLPYLVLNNETDKYYAQVAIETSSVGDINVNSLNSLLDDKRQSLPRNVNSKFDSIQVGMINGKLIPSKDKRAGWYLSIINTFGSYYE